MKKRFLCMLLGLILLGSLCVPVFAAEEATVIKNINEAAEAVYKTDFVAIYEAELYTDGAAPEDVYCVLCKGLDFSEFDPTQPRSYASCVKVALSNENNAYTKALVSLLEQFVPAGSKLVLIGHSLGGMVIQQVIAQNGVKERYEILNSVAIGSPYILTKTAKEGTLRRMVDCVDPVPYMSIPLLSNPYIGNACKEISGLSPLVHFRSYKDGECWKAYDCLGNKNGSAYLVLQTLLYA